MWGKVTLVRLMGWQEAPALGWVPSLRPGRVSLLYDWLFLGQASG